MQHKYSHKAHIITRILGEIVREKRKAIGKSQRLLADEYGVEKSLLNRIENGANETKLISLFTISELLDTKPSEIVKEIENRLPAEFSILDKNE